MKKAFSIVLVIFVLLAGFQTLVSVHYCGGRIADTKVSLTGDIASCGMEGDKGTCPVPGSNLNRNCCEDQISIAGIVNHYTAPPGAPENGLNDISKISFSQVDGFYPVSGTSAASFTSFYPPGSDLTSTVVLDKICVFRI